MNEQNEAYTTNEKADSTARAFGVVLLCMGVGIAYLVWPSGITDTTLAAMTFGALLRAVAAIAIGVVSLVAAAMFWM